MQVDDDILRISSDNLSDSIYDIKNAFEESSICRVRKIFAACCNDDPAEHALASEPNKKVFYIWVEWTNTNASCMFTARLTHQGAHALFKLDRRWGQPIVTERDEYGNPPEHAHWVVRRSSRFLVQEDEMYYLGLRTNEEIWQTYLAEGETEEDTDNEEEEDENDDKKDDEEPEDEEEEDIQAQELEQHESTLSLEEVIPIGELKRSSPIHLGDNSQLSLLMPVEEDNDAEIRELFNVIESDGEKNESALSKFQLEQLARGHLQNTEDVGPDLFTSNTITFPNGQTIDIN
jgi:hypothetical protein